MLNYSKFQKVLVSFGKQYQKVMGRICKIHTKKGTVQRAEENYLEKKKKAKKSGKCDIQGIYGSYILRQEEKHVRLMLRQGRMKINALFSAVPQRHSILPAQWSQSIVVSLPCMTVPSRYPKSSYCLQLSESWLSDSPAL